MDGYEILLKSYKYQASEMEKDGEDTTQINKSIKALTFLCTCDQEEKNALFDSGVFNDIVKAYCKVAMKNKGFSDAEIRTVLGELGGLFSDTSVDDILNDAI